MRGCDLWFEQGFVILNSLKAFKRRGDLFLWVGLLDLSFGIDFVNCKIAGPVEIEVWIKDVSIEAIDCVGVLLGDMAAPYRLRKQLPN